MSKLYLTILWHQHQPCYRDPVSGRLAMPWVRLHAVKDYIGLANLLAEFPALHQTINLVPSLVQQILEYLSGSTDTAMMLARVPADSLSSRQAIALLNTFFLANWDSMVRPYPRYRELLARAELTRKPRAQVAREFSVQDFRDLQVWGNLAWFHPTVIQQHRELCDLIEKGRNYTEDDKRVVLDRQLDVMAQVLPLHIRLARAGQLELTTSPFYHVIVPLLCDGAAARAARPDAPLPVPMFHSPEDAAAQVERGIALHERTFGTRPRGLWPPEGAVSATAADLFARAGIRWIVSDEEILAQTLGIHFTRDEEGMVDQPGDLYVPYRLSCGGSDLGIVFRDQALSNLIGFRYRLRDPLEAAEDLLARLRAIRRRAPENALVVIALDGENCWEYYRNQGVDFLRNLYRLLSEAADIETVHISDYLDRFGGRRELDSIFPGSWIGHSFDSWIGHPEKNRAWEQLARARGACGKQISSGTLPPDRAAAALEQLYIAEGSDWFWWYGDERVPATTAAFDNLFRKHLRRAYELAGLRTPDELLRPLTGPRLSESWTPPRGPLNVRVDGRRTSFFEWLGAGTYRLTHEGGHDEPSERAPVTSLAFGFGADRLVLCLDVAEPDWEQAEEFAVELWLAGLDEPALVVRFGGEGTQIEAVGGGPVDGIEVARDRVVEIGVPIERIGLNRGQTADFFLRVFEARSAVQRIPTVGTILLVVPENLEAGYLDAEGLV